MRKLLFAVAAATVAVPALPTAAVAQNYGGYYDRQGHYSGPTWRGRDGRTYCRRSDGTTGLVVGGAAGALIGRAIDTQGSRTTGTILGAAAGALLGREVERGRSRCR
jgi:hypothetical protein